MSIGLIPASNLLYNWVNSLFFSLAGYNLLTGLLFIFFVIIPLSQFVLHISVFILNKSNTYKEELIYKIIINLSIWVYGYLYFVYDLRPENHHNFFILAVILLSFIMPFNVHSDNDYGGNNKIEKSINDNLYMNESNDNIDELYYQMNQYSEDIGKLPKDFVLAWPESHFRKKADEIREVIVRSALFCKKINKYTPELKAELSNKYHSTNFILPDEQCIKINKIHQLLVDGHEVSETEKKMYDRHKNEVVLSVYKGHSEFFERVERGF